MLHGLCSDKANRDTFPSQHVLSFTILHDAVSRLGPPILDESQPPSLDPLQDLGSVRLETQNSAQLTDLFSLLDLSFRYTCASGCSTGDLKEEQMDHSWSSLGMDGASSTGRGHVFCLMQN